MSSLQVKMFRFTVPGQPQQKGSTRPFVHKGKAITTGANSKAKEWEQRIALAASEMFTEIESNLAVSLRCEFIFLRPKGHFGTGQNSKKLKNSAPCHNTKTPDVDKLLRAVADALTGVAYADDKQVNAISGQKRYARKGEQPGVVIEVEFADSLTVGELNEAMGVIG